MIKYHIPTIYDMMFEKEIIGFKSQIQYTNAKMLQLKFKQVLNASTKYSRWMTYDL